MWPPLYSSQHALLSFKSLSSFSAASQRKLIAFKGLVHLGQAHPVLQYKEMSLLEWYLFPFIGPPNLKREQPYKGEGHWGSFLEFWLPYQPFWMKNKPYYKSCRVWGEVVPTSKKEGKKNSERWMGVGRGSSSKKYKMAILSSGHQLSPLCFHLARALMFLHS